MLDIKKIREAPEEIAGRIKTRGFDVSFDKLLELDSQKRKLMSDSEQLKNQQNIVNKKIPELKKQNADVSKVFAEMKELSEQIKNENEQVRELENKIRDILLRIPNMPHESVNIGKNLEDNAEVRKFGEPTKFNFTPKPHWELGTELDITDFETAAKVAGSRFVFYKGLGAALERAITNFFLDTHISRGYTEMFPPFITNTRSLIGTGQLPKFDASNMFALKDTDYYLISTAEIPVTNYHRDHIFFASDLPKKYVAYSACFRAEAGSAGKDTRGLIRHHQFNKVELVKFALPENSYAELESLTRDAENVLQLLGLPYRVVSLCTSDLGFCSAKTYDLEVWMPSYNRYVEISSCSNYEDFQARRANIKFKRDKDSKAEYVHTLNGSGVAIGRTTAAILENFQQPNGKIKTPEVLKKYIKFDYECIE